ncbi:MAG: 2-C-methyl-D-erythritol 2,4-cyclodiphosphate synthase [Candidatus Marinimicrobia bacterium]|nr:2-C-methyl-D-erythritol 2,4-cyclodiphosphate synthase [Candidatus Neomarinimicrobiota bacterium]|tara:strand:- start:4217 stop:4699 length:483 start_codon:yes stop_codon:yes gene_type:complete
MFDSNYRIGNGVDVHPLVIGRKLILGGLHIDHHSGCEGHSDGDVLVHSIMDALLGAMNKGDIGTLFPSSDDRYKDADSLLLLDEIILLMKEECWRVVNVDSTIILQSPKIKPFINTMKDNFPSNWNLSIKATTTDHLGFIGEKKGLAVVTTCLLKQYDKS